MTLGEKQTRSWEPANAMPLHAFRYQH
jgi:hypothetical protein